MAVLLATVHAGPARGQANPEDVPLADFEDPASAALFAQDSRPLAKVTNERASGGASCLRMDFGRYIKGGPQWPGVFVSTADLPAPVDWSAYAALLLDVYTPTPAGGTLRIILKTGDGTNEEWYTAAEIPAGEWQLLRFPVSDIGAAIDLRRVTSLGFYMTRPERATVLFVDNVRLRPWNMTDPDALDLCLTSPAFNASFYHSNPEHEIAVRVLVRSPPETHRDLSCSLTVAAEDGTVLGSTELRAGNLGHTQTLTVRKPEMRDGDRVTARLAIRRGGHLLREEPFTITQRPASSDEVLLRGDGVTLVNGKPFFPLGFYQSPVAEFARLKAMGMNVVHTYRPADALYMEAADAAGLRVITAVKGTYAEAPHYHEPNWRESELTAYVTLLKDSPALLAFYLYDEPSPTHTPATKLKALCAVSRQADPYHLAVGCNNNHQYAYRQVADAMMVDSYPVPGRMTSLLTRTREGTKAQEPNRALWFIPQAFSWEPYCRVRTTDEAGHPVLRRNERPPTFDEARTMPWLALALGAKGLVYYSWQVQGFYVRDAYPTFWRGFEHHIRELVALSPWLLAPQPDQPVRCDNPSVYVTARQRGTDLLVATTNATDKPARATLVVPGLNGRRMVAVSEDRSVSPEGNTVAINCAPLETRIFLTGGATPKLPTLEAIRNEQLRLEEGYRRQNPSLCRYRDGAWLDASWTFPVPPAVKWASWYRMIDGWPGTPWVVGTAFRSGDITDWGDKDFTGAGRWIDVHFAQPKQVNMLRAIVSPWARIELRLPDGDRWRTVSSRTTPDATRRHHTHLSATTTARFAALTTDRFRLVFTAPRQEPEVVFELSAALASED